MEWYTNTLKRPNRQTFLFTLVLCGFCLLSGCSKMGIYSIVLSNNKVTPVSNDLNTLEGPFYQANVQIPDLIMPISEDLRNELLGKLADVRPYQINVSTSFGITNLPGLAKIPVTQCNRSGLGVIVMEEMVLKKGGKDIEVSMKVYCADDLPEDMDKDLILTDKYRIKFTNATAGCTDGFHTVELQFINPRVLKNKNSETLYGVKVTCVDE